ncbi:MAG: GDYXXLXY domain-containing protein [Candidatus Omnitrophota bacterium]
MKKKIIILATAILWLAIAMAAVISRQQILNTGKVVVLETAPVDPRDFLRGDYVVLNYRISRLDLGKIKSPMPYYYPGEAVYVQLEQKGKFWEPVAAYPQKDASLEGVFIKGKVKNHYYNQTLVVNYGIESYFVPEGEGKDIEDNMQRGKNPLSVEVAIAPSGAALIKRVYIDK